MAVNSPARIAIIGAGPIGLEAALYARCLGYDAAIFEMGRVAESVRRWGHVGMFSPFSMNRSNLGLALLLAQAPAYSAPDDDSLLTGQQWYQQYLLPLSKCDLLVGQIYEETEVVSVGREHLLKHELPGGAARGNERFRLLVRNDSGRERFELADVVIDTSGTFAQPNWLGQGGIPAAGELLYRGRIDYGLPDILGVKRERFASQATLVVGSGYSAATSVVALAKLAGEAPDTQVTWVTRRPIADETGPIPIIENDRLAARRELAVEANRLALSGNSPIRYVPGTTVAAISYDDAHNRFSVDFSGKVAGAATFDNVIANVGGHPDSSIFRELQVHQCYATEGPMKLAAALLGEASADCLDQQSHGPQTLVNPEPNFYILGSKSYGRNSNFLFSIGLRQIRELFTVISGRDDLDLYGNTSNYLT